MLYRTNAQSRVIEEAFMRLGVPYKVVGGTRFYDRREVKDAMAYLRAVVNPVDEVSVKRVLNVPKRGVGDASVARLDAFAARRGRSRSSTPCAAPTRPASPVRPCAASPPSSTCSTGSASWPAPTASVPAICCRRRSTESGYLGELEAEDTVEAHGRIENLGELVGSAREFTVLDEFLEQVSLVADTDDLDGDDQVVLMTLHSAKGLEFPVGVPRRRRGGDLPAHPGAHRARRDGGGAAAGLRRHHPGDAAPVHLARLEPDAVRQHAVQPAVAVPRRDPRRARRVDRATSAGARRTAGRATARATIAAATRDPPPYRRRGGDGATTDRRATRTASEWSTPRSRPGRATTPQPSNSQELGLHIGDDVEHPAFGEGVIIDISGVGEKAEAVINFAGVGTEAPGAGLGAAQEAPPLTRSDLSVPESAQSRSRRGRVSPNPDRRSDASRFADVLEFGAMKAAILVESLTGNTWKAAEMIGTNLQQERWTITGLSKVRAPDHASIQAADIVLVGTWTHGLFVVGQTPWALGRDRQPADDAWQAGGRVPHVRAQRRQEPRQASTARSRPPAPT